MGRAIILALFGLLALASAKPSNPDQFLYNEGMIGGDIAGGINLVEDIDGRTAIAWDNSYGPWPNAVVNFQLHSSLERHRALIMSAMNEFEVNTCIRFSETSSAANRVVMRGDYNTGCWSYMGMYRYGTQELSLQDGGCIYKGTIMHELMHAIGFYHEQIRYDRDSYVTIHYENIQAGMEHNFDRASLSASQDFGVPYDFDSIMHYELTAFTINGQRTISPIGEWANVDPGYVWQQNYLSAADIAELNYLYC